MAMAAAAEARDVAGKGDGTGDKRVAQDASHLEPWV